MAFLDHKKKKNIQTPPNHLFPSKNNVMYSLEELRSNKPLINKGKSCHSLKCVLNPQLIGIGRERPDRCISNRPTYFCVLFLLLRNHSRL